MAHPDGLPVVEVQTTLSGKLHRIDQALNPGDRLVLILEGEVTDTGLKKLKAGLRHVQSLGILDSYALPRDEALELLTRQRDAHRRLEDRRRGVEPLPFDRGSEVHVDGTSGVVITEEEAEAARGDGSGETGPDLEEAYCPECDQQLTREVVESFVDEDGHQAHLVNDLCPSCGWESGRYRLDADPTPPSNDPDDGKMFSEEETGAKPDPYAKENAPEEVRALLDGKVGEVKTRIAALGGKDIALIYAAERYERFWKDRKSVREALSAQITKITGPEPPRDDYEDLTVVEVKNWLEFMDDTDQLQRIDAYERSKAKPRKGVLDAIDRRLGDLWGQAAPQPGLPRMAEEPEEDDENEEGERDV